MRIAVIGGGPGGLFFSVLMKRADPRHEITVFERNPPDATFGFGVVFPERSLRYLRDADETTHAAFTEAMIQWDPIEYRHKDRILRFGGNVFSGIARAALLEILQQQARRLGTELRFRHEIASLSEVSGYDLIVAADGINSLARQALAKQPRPSIHIGRSRYIWLGTAQTFTALTFIFEESEHGWFGAHIYPYGADTSTFIVETDEDTWRRAGFDRTSESVRVPGESDLATLGYCERLFARHLNGHRLLANASRWLNFRTVRNRAWHAGNVVLLGDAAHTAHFSVGSGTRMAIEDAIALARALTDHADREAALVAYERERQPAVRRIQQAAEPSRRWWENYRHWTHFGPEQFAFHHLARTRLLTYGILKVRDERVVGEVETWFARTAGVRGRTPSARSPLLAPLRLRDVRLPNRVVAVEPDVFLLDGLSADQQVPGPIGRRDRAGAGLLLVGPAHAGSGQRPRFRTSGPLGLYLGNTADRSDAGGRVSDQVRLTRRAARAGFDVLVMHCAPLPSAPALLKAARKVWPARRPLCAHITAWSDPEDDRLVEAGLEFARALRAGGCDIVAVSPAASAERDPERAQVAQIYTSDLIRNVVGLPTMVIGGLYSVGDLAALILAGRADLCGWPALAWPGWRPRARPSVQETAGG